MEAPFFQRERVLQFSGCRRTVNKPELVPEDFVVEENANYWKDVLASEGASVDDRMVKMANLPSPPHQEGPSKVTQRGPLIFDPSPPTKEAEGVQLSATDKQAKLMQWSYHLGHLTFPKLKQLPSMGRSQQSSPMCCLSSVLAACSVR
jgi:hypothetical protein